MAAAPARTGTAGIPLFQATAGAVITRTTITPRRSTDPDYVHNLNMSSTVHIRRFDPHRDVDNLHACIVEQQDFHRAIESTWPHGAEIADAYFNYLMHQCQEHDGAFIVADAGDRMAGFACVVASVAGKSPDDPAVHAWVHDIFVRAEFRHQGVAKALMAAAETFARQRGARVMRLGVLDRNEGARAFYETIGFRDYSRVLTKQLD